MWIWLKEIYLGFLFSLYCNKQVTIDCDDSIIPVVTTYYSGPDFTKWQRSHGRKPMELHFVDGEEVKTPSPDVFYVVCGQGRTGRSIAEHEQLFFDPKVLKVLLEGHVFYFVRKMYEINPARALVSVKDAGKGVWSWMIYGVLILVTVMLHQVGKMIVGKLSMMDPVFSEFNIVSSNLQKFKDVPDRSMVQCLICFDDFVMEDEVRVLECKHYFHPMCIDRWLIGHSKRCPCCRGSIEINERV